MTDIELILIISISLLGTLIVLYFIFALSVYLLINHAFHRPQKGLSGLKYFVPEEFSDIECKHLSWIVNNNTLDGVLVTSRNEEVVQDKIIVFFHGIGAGYEAYTKEIRLLALKTQCPVVAFSLSGAGKSSGKKFSGIYPSLLETQIILNQLQLSPIGQNRDIYLVGHSLGGFIVSNVLTIKMLPQVKGIIALAAPNNFIDVFSDVMHATKALKILISLFFHIQYRKYAKITTAKSISYNVVPTLMIHGTRDRVVAFTNSGQKYVDIANQHTHIRAIAYQGRGHNLYLTPDSEHALHEMLVKASQYQKNRKSQKAAADNFFNQIDYDEIGQDDEEIFTLISEMIVKE